MRCIKEQDRFSSFLKGSHSSEGKIDKKTHNMKGALTGGIASYSDWIISKLLNIPELQLLHLWHEATNFCERWQIKHLCIWLKQTKNSHVLFPTPQKETLRKRKAQDPEIRSFNLREAQEGPGWRWSIPGWSCVPGSEATCPGQSRSEGPQIDCFKMKALIETRKHW